MDVDTKKRKPKSKKRQKLEKLKMEAKRRKLKAKSEAKERVDLKEVAMGARLKKKSKATSKFKEDMQEMDLDEYMMGARKKFKKLEAKSAPIEAMDQNGEMMDPGRKKKTKSKEKVDLKKLFRFQSFTERIANIRIDVSHRVGHTTDSPEDRETFFSEALQKWSQLNCTSEFVSFERVVRAKVDTLAQLVYHKDEIISKLKERLLVKHSLAYEPLLDLLVQFARDTQSEFYPYFKEMFPVLVRMCECQNADLIQCVFTTLAYLLKFLWRQMLKDLGNVFSLYSDLLSSSQRPHIRQFAVESFGFLLRKVRDLEGLVVMLFAEVAKDNELAEGVGQLLFEVCKGVPKQFHSCTEKLFPLLLRQLGSPQYSPSAVFQTLTKLIQLMAEHTRAQFSSPVWTPLLAQLKDAHTQWCEEGDASHALALSHTLHLVGVMVSWRNGSRITTGADMVQLVLKILSEPQLPSDILSVAVQLAASLILVSPNVPECHAHLAQLVKGVATCDGERSNNKEDVGIVLEFFQELADKYSGFEYDILPDCIQYCESALQINDNSVSVLKFLCELCLHFDPISANNGTIVNLAHSSFSLNLGNLPSLPAYNTRSHQAATKPHIIKHLERLLESGSAIVKSSMDESETEVEDKLELLWTTLVCFKYIRPVEKNCLVKFLVLFDALKDVLCPLDQNNAIEVVPEQKQQLRVESQHQQSEKTSRLLLLYSQCLSSFVSCFSNAGKERKEDGELSPPVTYVMQLLMQYPSSLPLLHSACQYSELVTDELTYERISEVLPLLHRNLSSPSSSVRLVTLRILKYFDQLSSSPADPTTSESHEDNVPSVDAIEICLIAEEIPAQLQTYRDKLLWLQKLKYGAHKFKSTTNRESPQEIPLRYLIGVLYVNFSLLWEPVCEIIRSYAVDEYKKPFWEVLGLYLEEASSLAECYSSPPTTDINHVSWHESLSSLFYHQSELMTTLQRGRPDHTNFRIQLWKCVAGFNTEFSESRSRILVPLLLRFVQNEFSLKENNFMESQDIRKALTGGDIASTSGVEDGSDKNIEEMDTVVEDDHDQIEEASSSGLPVDADSEKRKNDDNHREEDSAPSSNRGEKSSKGGAAKRQQQTSGRSLTKTLTTILTVFSHFHNPRSFYKDSELRQLYMKLLTHYDSEVQKLSLFCLLTYKPPHLLPYKENFELLLDDSSFREELSNFSMDSESSVVSADHREELLPILIRVLYGRMRKQGGLGSSKSGGNPRRGMVLRFLGGCEGSEMAEFINLLILPFKSLLPAPDDSIATKVDAGCVIPLKKQQGFLNMFGQMISILGSKLEPQMSVLFPITLKLGSFCAQLLEQRDQIQPHFVNALKILRQLVLARINECYGKFTEFDFSPYQEELFSALVWPQVTKLPQECIQNPTPLMKLLLTWSQHQQYHSLLSISIPQSIVESAGSSDTRSSILHYVYSCLSAQRVSPKVCSCVMEMTINLLSDYDSTNQKQRVAKKDALDSTETVEAGMGMEIESSGNGPDLVLSLIPMLLSYMSTVIESEGKRIKAGSESRNLHLEFTVISKISQFVKDPAESSHLIQLLLPFLSNSSEKYKKYEEDILLAVVNLSTLVDSFADFCRPISQLFGQISSRQSRSLLCTIFQELSEKDLDLQSTSSIIQKLNSWDKKHVDEPDYNLRLEGFSAAKQLIEESEEALSTKVYLVLPILHNALFFLSQSEDMSIRDAAASFVTDLISHIKSQDGDAFQLLVMTTMVAAVKKGLRSKLEFARQEYISVLSQLVKAFPAHPRFSSMATLSHHEPEADFFENVRHIQLHRRTRAFRKLAGLCAERTLTQACIMNFILPLANHVVFTPVTNTEQNLVAETVNVIGSIAAQLSWANYSFILHHYLRQLPRKLDIQKTLIKAVVAVLDNFHFDLSLAQPWNQNATTSSTSDKEQQASSQNLSEGEDIPPEIDTKTEVEDETTCGEEENQEELEMEEESKGLQEEKEKSVGEDDLTKQKAIAQKIHKAIVNSILPSLEAVLTKRIDVPGHKLSRLSHEDESNSEQLRVPVAMAITKLLLTLPEETLHTQLPSLLLKVCQTLKNRLRDVRDAGRDTLVKMSCALGPKYLRYIVKEMKDMLNRGYMLHVLGYSLHSILRGISSPSTKSLTPSSSSTVPIPMAVPLKPGNLDTCLDLISSILIEDLFGTPAEERESGENVAKIPESKTPQSYNCYEIVAQFLSPQLIPDLLTPVREVLESKSTSRIAHTVEEICRRVSLGIQNNKGFTPQALLVFVYSALNDSIPQLSNKSISKPHPSSSSSESHDRPEDSRLIPPEPGRSGPKPVSAGSVGASIITEFGLQLLHIGLKRGKFDSSSEEQLGMLDPFVPLLAKSLGSRHVKVLSRTLQCLVWIIRMPLPSLGSHMHEISTHLFGLLRRYARAGAAVGSNRELVNSSFKAMTVILRDFRKQDVSEDELTVLLSFVEEDIYDHQRQSTAFPLLKAILGRKFVSSEVFELMQKVCQLSVTSDSEHVRQQCRQCILQFMMDYPLGKKLNRYLDFFVINLSYEHQSGRESVIEQLSSIFTKFPERLLNNHATFFFVPLCCQLVNEESKTVREMIGETMKTLMSRMDTVRSNEMQRIIESWFKSDQLIQQRLASLVLGLWVEVEGQSFEKRLPLFLPLLYECACLYDPNAPDGLRVTEEVAAAEQEEKEGEDGMEESNEDSNNATGTENGKIKDGESGMEVESSEATTSQTDSQATNVRLLDQLLFSVLSTLRKICSVCSVLRGSTYCQIMNQIWEQVQVLLLHPHAWVRLTSSQLYGLLFSGYTPDELVAIATQEDSSGQSQAKSGKSKKKRKSVQKKEVREYIHQETVTKAQDLSHAFCIQLSSHLLFAELANQSVKNLVFLGKVLHRFGIAGVLKHKEGREEDDSDRGEEGERQRVRNLNWLVERMLRLARFEAAQHPKESLKRTSVLQWTAAISVDLGIEHLPTYLPTLLRPVYRELADSNKTGGEELHSLAQEVLDLMKGVCGKEVFSQAYAQVHQTVLSSREKRRQQAALEAVANPQKSIRRKHRKHELKRLAKKRQLLFYRPTGTAAAASRKRLKRKH